MALPCVWRRVCKKLLNGHLKSSAAIISSFRPYSTFGQHGNYLDQQSQLLGQGVQHSPRGQLLTNICLQNVMNFSLTQKRSVGTIHDHAKLWAAERVLSAGLVVIIPVALIFPSKFMDTILAVSMVLHNHWGLEACVTDYVRPKLYGPMIPKVALGWTYFISILTLVGLFYLIFRDMGLANAILRFWKL